MVVHVALRVWHKAAAKHIFLKCATTQKTHDKKAEINAAATGMKGGKVLVEETTPAAMPLPQE